MFMQKNRNALKILSVLFVFLIAAACTQAAPGAPAQTSEPAAEAASSSAPAGGSGEAPAGKTQLQVLFYDDDLYQAVIDDFEAKNPDIEIVRKSSQKIDTGAITSMLSAADAPDVLIVNAGPGRVMPLAEAGFLEDLTEAYTTRGWENTVQPSILETLKSQSDTLYEIGNGYDVFSVYYHKDMFEEQGLTPPTTWDEFINVCETFKQAGVTPLLLGARDNYQLGWTVGNFMQSYAGKDFVNGLIFGDESFADERYTSALEGLLEFYNNGYINEDIISINAEEAFPAFITKQSAMTICQQGSLQLFFDDGTIAIEAIGSFPFPSQMGGEALPIAGSGHSWIMNKNSQNKDAAYRFLDYIASEDYQIALGSVSGWGYGIGAAKVDDLSKLNLNPIVQAAFEQLEKGTGYNPSVYLPGDLKNVYYATNQELLTGTKTPQQIGEELQQSKESGA